MSHLFHTYMARRTKTESTKDMPFSEQVWINNATSAYDALSLRHKIIHCVRQRFIHSYFKHVCDIYHVDGPSIFTDMEAEFNRREKRIDDEINYANVGDYDDAWSIAKSFITRCRYIKGYMPPNEARELVRPDINDIMGFFIDQNTEENFVPSVGGLDAIKGIVAFILYAVKQHVPITEMDTFIPDPCVLYPMYSGNGVVWVNKVQVAEPGYLPERKLREDYKFHDHILSYLNMLNLSGQDFNAIMLSLSCLAVVNDSRSATGFQRLCNVVNNYYLSGQRLSNKWEAKLPAPIFLATMRFMSALVTENNVKVDNLHLLHFIYDHAPPIYANLGDVVKKAIGGRYVNQHEVAMLKKYGISKIVPMKRSYDLYNHIRMNAADDDLGEDESVTENDTGEGDGEEVTGDKNVDAGDADSDTNISDPDADGSAEGEEEPEETHIVKIDDAGIEFELSSGNLSFAEYILRERIIKRLNTILANPGNLSAEKVEYLKYFRNHWIYLVSINTLLAITKNLNIEGV